MSDQQPQWPIERRTMQAHLAAEAAANPGGWVYEIDGSMVSNLDGYVPAEAILGGFVRGTVRAREDAWTAARMEGDVCPALTWSGWDVTLDLATGRERSRVVTK